VARFTTRLISPNSASYPWALHSCLNNARQQKSMMRGGDLLKVWRGSLGFFAQGD